MEHNTGEDGSCSCGFKHPRMRDGKFNTTVGLQPDGLGFYLTEYRNAEGVPEISGETLF